ncbi:hypothetical protein Goshw_015960 [Gossypium schwendimanii]|uniref:Reverse transcriptase zinc-binding domain-containing protein n=1 Tax=Gossypium schwendimanii TaxID=34291 RepID=A0A7J9KLL4_GOSSC|nr:hypothetical protein [Gossypium schwendimanii]
MWALNVPSKIRIHMWRVTNEFVPMLYNLRARKLVVNALCPVCQAKKKIVSHLFRDYTFTQQVLRELGVTHSTTNRESNWKKWLALEFKNYSNEACKTRAISIWALWYNHNRIYHEKIRQRAHEIVGCISAYCSEITGNGFSRYMCWGQRANVIRRLNSAEEDRSCISSVIQEINGRAPKFRRLWFRFMPREANKAVHGMTLERWRCDNPQYWIKEVQHVVEELVNCDRSGEDDDG